MMTVLSTMIRREIQEHKLAFIYAPFIVALVLCLVIISVYLGLTDIQTTNFNFSTELKLRQPIAVRNEFIKRFSFLLDQLHKS